MGNRPILIQTHDAWSLVISALHDQPILLATLSDVGPALASLRAESSDEAAVTWDELAAVDELEVELRQTTRVFTESSLWIIKPAIGGGRYLRLPKSEEPRPQAPESKNTWGRITDGEWKDLRPHGILLQPSWPRLRVRPVAGPIDGAGVTTGILAST